MGLKLSYLPAACQHMHKKYVPIGTTGLRRYLTWSNKPVVLGIGACSFDAALSVEVFVLTQRIIKPNILSRSYLKSGPNAATSAAPTLTYALCRAVASGGSGAPASHFMFGPQVAAYIQCCIKKCGPLCFLVTLLRNPGDGPDVNPAQLNPVVVNSERVKHAEWPNVSGIDSEHPMQWPA